MDYDHNVRYNHLSLQEKLKTHVNDRCTVLDHRCFARIATV